MSLLNKPYTHPDIEAACAAPATRYRKGRDGFEALTEIPLPGVKTAAGGLSPEEGDVAVLQITTSKRSSGGLATSASVVTKRREGVFSFVLYKDYMKTVGANPVRCTEKNVRALHALVLEKVAGIEADARAFYAPKAAA